MGKGEQEPRPYFFQNLGEAEYVVATYMYMRLLGYRADQIVILTSYNGQKALIKDVIAAKCSWHPLIGSPKAVETVDKFQGQQADYVLLSLVRTKTVGHIRDMRRLVVAVSRARLGLYVFGRAGAWFPPMMPTILANSLVSELFASCFEIKRTMDQLLSSPTDIQVRFRVVHVSGQRGAYFPSASAQRNCPRNTQSRWCRRSSFRRGTGPFTTKTPSQNPVSPANVSQSLTTLCRLFTPLPIFNLSLASCCSSQRPQPQPRVHVPWIASKMVAGCLL